jgi:uncharacterized membrane protein YeaQ/YmgE (transglycosylase-associated protein family)
MEKWLKVLSIIGICFCFASLIWSTNNPEGFVYSILIGLIWVPQSILSLLLIGRLRKIRNFFQEHIVIPGRAFLYRLCSDEIPN